MDAQRYGSTSPGQLVLTSGKERVVVGGRVVYEDFRGLAFLPTPLPPATVESDLIARLWREWSEATNALKELNGLSRTLENPHLISKPFRIREAQASSRIENTYASAEDIAAGDDGIDVRDESREVHNYLVALEEGIESEAPLSEWLIRSMHKTLMSGVRGEEKRPGEYREGQAYIAGETERFADARFVPPPADRVADCMHAFADFIGELPESIPPLLSIGLAHYQFETIHPFADGNGRLGRILVLQQLCREGLIARPLIYVSSFFDRHRDVYYDTLLGVSERGDWESWLRFFCQAVHTQASDAVRRTDRLLDLRRELIRRVTEPRAPANLRGVVDSLFTNPVTRAPTLARRLNVKTQQAQRYIDRLEDRGILTEITGGSYGRLYAAREVLQLIEGGPIED